MKGARHHAFTLVLALACLGGGSALAQDAAGSFEYVVRAGDTCSVIAARVYGDRRRYDLVHQLNPQLGAPPHRLRQGMVLRLPRRSPREATLTQARRVVESRSPSSHQWRRAQAGLELERGQQVVTRERASAEIAWRDGSTLQMREQTLVIVYRSAQHSTRRVADRAVLERGTLRGRLAELAGVSVQTPSSVATLRGGEVVVGVDETGVSRVANFDGEATVSSEGAEVSLPAGTGTVVSPGRRPSRPRPLPEAPRWANDLAGRFVGVSPVGGTLRGSWHPVESASRYRVEISQRVPGPGDDGRMARDLVAALEIDASETSFEIHHIPRGTYYLTVSTIDGSHLEGRPSPQRAMVVREARIVPPGGGEPPADVFDPGDPSLPFAAPEVLVGTWLVAPLGLRCAPLGQDPGGISTLRALGRQTIRCVDRSDREIPGFEVEVTRARAWSEATLARNSQPTEVTLSLSSPLSLPTQLVGRAPEGVAIGPITRGEDGLFHTTLSVREDAPDDVQIELAIAAGTELIDIATLDVATRAVADSPPLPPTPEPTPDAVTRAPPQSLFERSTLPAQLGLLADPRSEAWAALALLDSERAPAQTRLVMGGSTPDFGGASLFARVVVELGPRDQSPDRAGHGDIIGGAQVRLLDGDSLDLDVSFSAWFPSGPEDGGVGSYRLTPAAQLGWQRGRLRLRSRQGFIGGIGSDRSRVWASAYGADATFSRGSIGVEIDASAGRGHEGRFFGGVAAGVAGELSLGPITAGLGARLALNEDAAATMGRWMAMFTLAAHGR